MSYYEEETQVKAYDSKLMKRLMSYAKKYWAFFAAAILLLVAVTVIDLLKPYFIKIAIDDYLNGYQKPMITYEASSGVEGVEFEGRIYKRVESVPEEIPEDRVFFIDYVDNIPYLVNGIVEPEMMGSATVAEISEESRQYQLHYGDSIILEARRLDRNEVKIFRSKDLNAMKTIGIIFILAIIAGFLFNFLQTYILNYVGQTIIFNIRQEIFSHIQKMPIAFFDKNPVGRLVTRVTNDTETLNDMYTNVLVSLLKDFCILVGVIIIMFSMNTVLALIIIGAIPVVVLVTVFFRKNARKAYRRIRVALARINTVLSENISGMRVIQIFDRQKEKLEEFKKTNKEYYKATMGEVVVSGVFRPLIELISSATIAALLWFGGIRVLDGTLQFGVLFAFVDYVGQFFHPINDMAEKYNILQAAMASSERIFGILDTPGEPDEGSIEMDKDRIKGDIEFKNVWFAYNDDEWVLKDVSFKVPAGKTLAIVGATGAGKTSIINLLNRFYEIRKGQILMDGIDIRQIKKKSLRENVGMVLQDVFLFSGTVMENIRLNEDRISDEEVKKASAYVNADGFIQGLPNGYDEEVKERGATFSAGQRQLLAFARALAFDPSILILDEATANIDTETELLIQDALAKLTRNRTTIVIAHRLSTIQHADNIIVLHKGRIREMGNHQELLAKRGMYYNLYKLQYEGNRA
ncbi:ABC transporter ATP-binding protein [Clostridium thermosuccinogenes]|uniref:ABC transporter ATP-binding protein n=1 Tax=Clostridium thermosuccinogenes TaxID=84032 RepID=UPI001FA926ED|nr:ABC transporter ATP-binding protein [Pseudoclostridium thermosuccinogenes]